MSDPIAGQVWRPMSADPQHLPRIVTRLTRHGNVCWKRYPVRTVISSTASRAEWDAWAAKTRAQPAEMVP